MALNQTNKLVWIMEIIYRAHKNPFEKLNLRWIDFQQELLWNVENLKCSNFYDYVRRLQEK